MALIRVSDGLRITTPAVVTLIGYLILVVVVLLPFDMYAWDEKKKDYKRHKYDLAQRLLLLLLLMFPLLLSVYSVNCFVVGKCVPFAWIVASVTIIWAIAVIVAALVNKSFNVDDVLA